MTNEEPGPLVSAVQSGNTRRSLVALRDLLAYEIEGNRCKTCQMTQMRTGEFSALALRLQKVIEDLENLPPEEDEDDGKEGKVVGLAYYQNLRARGDGAPVSKDSPRTDLGTKNAARRQGGRRRSGG